MSASRIPRSTRSSPAFLRKLVFIMRPTAQPANGRYLFPGPGRTSGFGIVRAFRKYTKILRVSLIERMTYRGDFFLSTILRFLPMVTTILLWQAIYQGAGEDNAETVELSGYSLHDMIAYLLLVHISRMFSSMPGLAAGITR